MLPKETKLKNGKSEDHPIRNGSSVHNKSHKTDDKDRNAHAKDGKKTHSNLPSNNNTHPPSASEVKSVQHNKSKVSLWCCFSFSICFNGYRVLYISLMQVLYVFHTKPKYS